MYWSSYIASINKYDMWHVTVTTFSLFKFYTRHTKAKAMRRAVEIGLPKRCDGKKIRNRMLFKNQFCKKAFC